MHARRNGLRVRAGTVLSAGAPVDHVGKARGLGRRRTACDQGTLDLTVNFSLFCQDAIDAEATPSGDEQDECAAKEGKVLQEIVVLGRHLRRWVFPITMRQRGRANE